MNDFPSPPSENRASTKQKRMFSGFLGTIMVKIFFVIALLLSITAVSALGQTKQAHANSLWANPPLEFYRLYNGTDHFYTLNWDEVLSAEKGGYNYEGVAGYVDFCTSDMVCGALYRLYNGTDHFYTADASEAARAMDSGYRYEGVAANICLTSCGDVTIDGYTYHNVPFYRLYNGKDHFYTTDWNEALSAEKGGYNYEGVVGYIYAF